MGVTVVLGTQWGDEGKGKIVDMLAARIAQRLEGRNILYAVRFNGGANAGHTVVNEHGTFKLQLIPSAACLPHAICILGSGMLVDTRLLTKEIEMLESAGIQLEGRLKISERAHLVFPWHQARDEAEEMRRGNKSLGTTRRGIGPAHVDKMMRSGIRAESLRDPATFVDKMRDAYMTNRNLLAFLKSKTKLEPFDSLAEEFRTHAQMLGALVEDTETRLTDSVYWRNDEIILEGAQGARLDIDFGTYPFVTSSPTDIGAAIHATGVPPHKITRVIGVAKAYMTRVGAGPFPTEMPDDIATRVRNAGHEFGTVTGRPRRCGWLDLISLNDAILRNGMREIALTKLDVLDSLSPLRVAVSSGDGFDALIPESGYRNFHGWSESLGGIKSYRELPYRAIDYVREIEKGLPRFAAITYCSTGPARDETIEITEEDRKNFKMRL